MKARFQYRSAVRLARGLLDPRQLVVLRRIFRTCHEPVGFLVRYLSSSGTYPWTCRLRTPAGDVSVELFSPHDVLTVNEIFCREDYPCPPDARVVVDVGSNIGISALYFMCYAPTSFVYCFEPDPRNQVRLQTNLADLVGRFQLSQEAVGPFGGSVAFGTEPTGRYGGIGMAGDRQIQVGCRHVNDVLRDVIGTHGSVDVLKLDIEGLEAQTVRAIEPGLLPHIRTICMEAPAHEQPHLDGFTHRFRFDTHVYSRTA